MVSLSERRKYQLYTWIVFVAVGGLVGFLYIRLTAGSRLPEVVATYPGLRGGLLIAGLSAGLELFLISGSLGYWMFKRPFYQTLFLRLMMHWLLITGALLLGHKSTEILVGASQEVDYGIEWILPDTIAAFFILALMLFFIQMRTLIGGRALMNFLTGRYHRPVEEERIFLLIDVVGSTHLAKKLGDRKFYNYLSDFFGDLDSVVFENRGEVYSYIGDAVIVTWPLKKFRGSHRVIETILQGQQRMEKRGDWYKKRYGVWPKFRAIVHGGNIMAGEYGGYRRQITYLGDVINTTARLENLCKELEVSVLLSEAAVGMVTIPSTVTLRDLGSHGLKGLDQPVKVFGLDQVA